MTADATLSAPRDARIIPVVVRQHAEESAFLHELRTTLTHSAHIRLRQIARFDERLAAHLDGLEVAGPRAWQFCEELLAAGAGGAMFTITVRAITEKDSVRTDRCFALAQAVPKMRPSLWAAFGWLPRDTLQGFVMKLLASEDPFKRTTGIAACAMHRVDPGLMSNGDLTSREPLVRARALRTAGELGCQDAVALCSRVVQDANDECRFWGLWSATLLGDRTVLEALTSMADADGVLRDRAFTLAVQAMDLQRAHKWLRDIATSATEIRRLIEGSGIAGDPNYVPWLIGKMSEPKTARLAADAFVLVTGADLEALRLEGPKLDVQTGPNDDPNDANVESDPDDGLPWPDSQRISTWWAANEGRFQRGVRYFMGAPVTREHCINVLKTGSQRQRVLAAQYLCLLEPGTPLFNTRAPAWRQQRWLAKMS